MANKQTKARARKANGKSAESKAPKQQADQYSGIGGKIAEFRDFFESSKVEMKKVTWPSRKETTTTSIAVLVFSIVVAIYLGLVDYLLTSLVALVLS